LAPERALGSTGIAACDAYLARVEACTGAMLGPQGRANVRESLDLMRRNFRRSLEQGGSPEMLDDSCTTSRRTYDRSVASSCPQGSGVSPKGA